MVTVNLADVETGPASTIASASFTNVRSVNFHQTGIIIIESENGSLKEIDVDSIATVTVTVDGTNLTFDIAGS